MTRTTPATAFTTENTPRLPLWRRLLSVRHIVALLTAACLVAAGGAALALVVPAAVGKLRALGEQQAALLAHDALRRVRELYAAPMQQLETLVNLTRDVSEDEWEWPSASAAAFNRTSRLHARAVSAVAKSDPTRNFFYLTGYLDTTAFAVGVNPESAGSFTTTQCVEYVDNTTSTTEPWVPDQNNVSDMERFSRTTRRRAFISPRASGGVLAPIAACGTDDPAATTAIGRAREGPNTVNFYVPGQLLGFPQRPVVFFETFAPAAAPTIGSLFNDNVITPVFTLIASLNVIRAADGSERRVGYALVATALTTLQRSLCELSRTAVPGWQAMVMNGHGELYATSECGIEQVGEAVPLGPWPVGFGCPTTLEFDAELNFRGNLGMYCVPSVDGSSDPIHQAIAPLVLVDAARMSVFNARRMMLDGESYFVSVAVADLGRYTAGLANSRHPRVVTLVPEASVTGAVLRANFVAVGVAAGLTAVAALAAAVLIALLTRPLPRLAKGMADAAAMRDVPSASGAASVTASCFGELDVLEDAARLMHDELSHLRAFVPASLRYRAPHDGESSSSFSNRGGRSTSKSLTGSTSDGTAENRSTATPHAQRQAPDQRSVVVDKAFRRYGRRLERRRVTVVAARVLGVADSLVAGDPVSSHVLQAASELFRVVNGGASAHGGVLLHVDPGADGFVVAFNAVRPCESHAAQGCRFATWLNHAMQRVGAPGARCGVATGACLVGNLGTERAKVHTAVGAPVEHARSLCSLTVMYGTGCYALASQGTLEAAERHVALGTVDFLRLPTATVQGGTDVAPKRSIPKSRGVAKMKPAPSAAGETPGGFPPHQTPQHKPQRVAAVLRPSLPWHTAAADDEDSAAVADNDDDGVSLHSFSSLFDGGGGGEFRDQHAEEVAGWLGMGDGGDDQQRNASPLCRWNSACKLLLPLVAGPPAANMAAATAREAIDAAVAMSMDAVVVDGARASLARLRIVATAQVPRLLATCSIHAGFASVRQAPASRPPRAPPRASTSEASGSSMLEQKRSAAHGAALVPFKPLMTNTSAPQPPRAPKSGRGGPLMRFAVDAAYPTDSIVRSGRFTSVMGRLTNRWISLAAAGAKSRRHESGPQRPRRASPEGQVDAPAECIPGFVA